MYDFSFYKDKKVLLTGHTGFKGSWLCEVLLMHGADITGYALTPPTSPSLFEQCGIANWIHSVVGDIRDLTHLKRVFEETQPEIVIHMAAQPIVRTSYRDPVTTYQTNVLGTVNVLECCRLTGSVKSVINVTTDKVYKNNEWERGYVETDILDGYDPYSNSKSCSELVTHSYVRSFLQDMNIAVSTCRAGNVIGGGDYADDRIIPDCLRAVKKHEPIIVRNPYSIRPYQHVLDPVCVYLMIAMEQYKDHTLADCYNVGPDDSDCYKTGDLADLFCNKWNGLHYDEKNNEPNTFRAVWKNEYDGGPHEASFLKLDCTKLKQTFGWAPVWSVPDAMDEIVHFASADNNNGNYHELVRTSIHRFLEQI